MSLPRRLYELQQIDLELQQEHQALSEIENQLNDDQTLVATRSRFAAQKQQLEMGKKEQRSIEWELEDLDEKVKQINSKLYSGTTKNPKELVNLESEVKGLRNRMGSKEDKLLELMASVEELEAEVKAIAGELQLVEQEWQRRQETLSQGKVGIEAKLARLNENRQELAQQIDSEVLRLYEQIRLTRGQAIVEVEQGRCQGCHITLPTSQWQKVKAGDLIQCNSCSRILYLA